MKSSMQSRPGREAGWVVLIVLLAALPAAAQSTGAGSATSSTMRTTQPASRPGRGCILDFILLLLLLMYSVTEVPATGAALARKVYATPNSARNLAEAEGSVKR